MAISLDRPVPLKKLEAVNIVLQSRGESPTAKLGSEAREAAQNAENALAATSIRIQSENWTFNRETNLLLGRDPSGNIYLPENLLSHKLIGTSVGLSVVERGGRLYDQYNSTFQFTEDIYVEAALALPFEDLPQPARWYIALAASLEHANREVPGDPSLRPTQVQLYEAKAALETYDKSLRNPNLRSNPHFRRLRGGR